MNLTPLTVEEITKYMDSLPNWKIKNNALEKTFQLHTFEAAMDFTFDVSKIAQKLRHHPLINNRELNVEFRITTFDAGNKVTMYDIELAKGIEELWNSKYL